MFLMSEIVTSNFFFFKQKTAYEMRISYWISGVCSSDLLFFWNKGGTEVFCWVVPMGIFTIIFSSICSIDGIGAVASSRADRQSVVEGKSVSVRVDLGGRRINKTKLYDHKPRSNISVIW